MSKNSLQILNWLLTAKPETGAGKFESVVDWKRQHEKELLAWAEPVDMAIAGGFLATCPAYAFAAGYWAALHRLIPDLPKEPVPALCISEKQGPHPAGINCRLEKSGDGWRLDGKKHFVTCGREADLLLVAASTGKDPDGKNRLRLLQVEAKQRGIKAEPPGKPLAMLPEISHCALVFSGVTLPAASILPGDAYVEYIKPFRTIEDLHVSAAILGYFLQIATRFAWPQALITQLLAQTATVRTLARADYKAPEIHIAVDGALTALQTLLAAGENCWASVPAEVRLAWMRDRAVLAMAATARAKRLAAAWNMFS